MLMTEALKTGGQLIEDYITIEQAVEQTGYTGQYLRRMAREGKIRAVKFGAFWMIHLGSLQEYLAQAENTADKRYGPREVDA
jgi:excisionase family DNA binding protein